MKNKRCKKCDLPVRFSGRQWVCAPCHKEYATAWRLKNADRIKQKSKEAYQKNKESIARYSKEYYAANKDKITQYKKDWWRKDIVENRLRDRARKRGTTFETVVYLENKQKGLCRICGETNGDKALCIDHNHATNKVRALLCARCNAGIGMFRESRDLLSNAAEYLAEFEEEKVACP
jgi:uncharacterized Zn finger protein (UPF0148 family)